MTRSPRRRGEAKEFADFQADLYDENDALAELEAAKVALKHEMEMAAKIAAVEGASVSLVELEEKASRIARVVEPATSARSRPDKQQACRHGRHQAGRTARTVAHIP